VTCDQSEFFTEPSSPHTQNLSLPHCGLDQSRGKAYAIKTNPLQAKTLLAYMQLDCGCEAILDGPSFLGERARHRALFGALPKYSLF
jgi:hypothetical protein